MEIISSRRQCVLSRVTFDIKSILCVYCYLHLLFIVLPILFFHDKLLNLPAMCCWISRIAYSMVLFVDTRLLLLKQRQLKFQCLDKRWCSRGLKYARNSGALFPQTPLNSLYAEVFCVRYEYHSFCHYTSSHTRIERWQEIIYSDTLCPAIVEMDVMLLPSLNWRHVVHIVFPVLIWWF